MKITYYPILLILFFSFSLPAQTIETQVDSLINKWKSEDFPGIAIGIIKSDQLILNKGYGIANLDYNIPITADSKFELASISKQFTATCIAILALENKLSFDDKAIKYLQDLPEYMSDIKISHLLHHTSGIKDYMELFYLSGVSFESKQSNSDAIKLILEQQSLNNPPGEEFIYSNSGYILLAEIVTKISGKSLNQFASEKLFKPLGMSNTFFCNNSNEIIKNRVISYGESNDTLFRYNQNRETIGPGGLISTVNDLFLWDQNYDQYKVGGEKLKKLQFDKGLLNNGDTLKYGLGVNFMDYKENEAIEHSGVDLGFKNLYLNFYKQDVSIIVLSNFENINPYQIAFQITDIVLENSLSEKSANKKENLKKISPVLKPDELSNYVGSFWEPKKGITRKTYVKNDTLWYYLNDNNIYALMPIDVHKFKTLGSKSNNEISFVFSNDKIEKIAFQKDDYEPFELLAFEPAIYSEIELREFSGDFYSRELDCKYRVEVIEDYLRVYIDNKELCDFKPLELNLFTNKEFIHIKYDIDKNGFILNSERIRNIKFIRK